jgi:hypothetical protein
MVQKNNAPGFNIWQAYVASIAGLLVALLLLLGIVGMATTVIQEAIEKGLISEDGSVVSECPGLVHCKKEIASDIDPEQEETQSAVSSLKRALTEQNISGSQGHRFEIQFPANFENGNQWAADLQKSLKSYTDQKNAVWHIYSVSDSTDKQDLKNAYLRNLTVRQALLQSGVKSEHIETFIDGEPVSGSTLKKSSVALTIFFDK